MTTPTRTLRFYGKAYGETPVSLTVSINGNELFNGPVSTAPGTPPRGLANNEQEILFTVPFPRGATGRGSFPMTVAVSGGDSVILGSIDSNYAPTGVGTDTGADTYWGVYNGDARSDVQIDGVAQADPVREAEYTGSYCWLVYTGSTLSCNLNLA